MAIRKVPTATGGEVQVRDEEFDTVAEPWSLYKLKGGGTVKIRTTALMIGRVLDEHGEPTYTPDGQPNLLISSQSQVVASEDKE
jgi:hypothetical protein